MLANPSTFTSYILALFKKESLNARCIEAIEMHHVIFPLPRKLFKTSRRFSASSGKNRLVARVSIPSSDILGVTAKVCGLLGLKILFRRFLRYFSAFNGT